MVTRYTIWLTDEQQQDAGVKIGWYFYWTPYMLFYAM